jgi:hypothetical protein
VFPSEAHCTGISRGGGRHKIPSTFARIHEAEFIPAAERSRKRTSDGTVAASAAARTLSDARDVEASSIDDTTEFSSAAVLPALPFDDFFWMLRLRNSKGKFRT